MFRPEMRQLGSRNASITCTTSRNPDGRRRQWQRLLLARSSTKSEVNVLVSFSDAVVISDDDGIVLGNESNFSRFGRIQFPAIVLLLMFKNPLKRGLNLTIVRSMKIIRDCSITTVRESVLICLVVFHCKQ